METLILGNAHAFLGLSCMKLVGRMKAQSASPLFVKSDPRQNAIVKGIWGGPLLDTM